MAKVTLEQLSEFGACSRQRAKFANYFGNEAEITVEACLKYAQAFDFGWALEVLLPRETWQRLRQVVDDIWSGSAGQGSEGEREANEMLAELFAREYIAACGDEERP